MAKKTTTKAKATESLAKVLAKIEALEKNLKQQLRDLAEMKRQLRQAK